jgi:transposase-like protein
VPDRLCRVPPASAGPIISGGILMDDILDFFVCDACSNKDFSLVYNFCLRFHGVNFSDDLIYDKIIEERYQCTACKKTFTKKEVEEALSRLRKKRKRS